MTPFFVQILKTRAPPPPLDLGGRKLWFMKDYNSFSHDIKYTNNFDKERYAFTILKLFHLMGN